jgi:hypothetical protein
MQLKTFGGKEIGAEEIDHIISGGITSADGTLVRLKNGQTEFLRHSSADVIAEINKVGSN